MGTEHPHTPPKDELHIDAWVSAFEGLFPRFLAASWDNTGLLLRGTRPVARVGLTIDLTEGVAQELLAAGCDLLLAYHPPIFSGLKRLDGANALGRTLLDLVRAGVHVYAPHTALDAAPGGMGDWLAGAFGTQTTCTPVEPDARLPGAGLGRRGQLSEERSLVDLLPQIATHLGLHHLRVAGDLHLPRRSFAVCPGAGGDLFGREPAHAVLLTGELRHHDVLARVAEGGAVVLTDHTNCERGYLPHLATRLQTTIGLPCVVSQVDADPLRVWTPAG
jgi:dinuclear metal center YbgI/SA1388 family protein